MKAYRLVSVLAVASCTASTTTTQRIPIGGNDVGAVAIEIDELDSGGDAVFELRGLDANDTEVARIQMRVGTIAELPPLDGADPGSEQLGSELVMTGGGDETRSISREIHVRRVAATEHPSLASFIELDAVASALARAGIVIEKRPVANETDYEYTTIVTCPVGYEYTDPVAQQCCFSSGTGVASYTVQIPATGAQAGKFGRRWGPAAPCTSSTGGTCSGSACYFGPAGFARPDIFTTGYSGNKDPGTHRDVGQFFLQTGDYRCVWNIYASNPPAIQFGNVTGSLAKGAGCPGGTSGAGAWDL